MSRLSIATIALTIVLFSTSPSTATLAVAQQDFDSVSTWDGFSVATLGSGAATVETELFSGNNFLLIDGDVQADITLSQSGLGGLGAATFSFDYNAISAGLFDGIAVTITQDGVTGATTNLDVSPGLQTFSFALNAGVSSVSIQIDADNLDALGDSAIALDNFVLAAVPEPSAFLFGSLLAVGLGTVVARRSSPKQPCVASVVSKSEE